MTHHQIMIHEAELEAERLAADELEARERAEGEIDPDALFDLAFSAARLCDGSGIVDERYVDVDYTVQTRCAGCVACDDAMYSGLMADYEAGRLLDPAPVWDGMEVYETRRRPVLPELAPDFKFIVMRESA